MKTQNVNIPDSDLHVYLPVRGPQETLKVQNVDTDGCDPLDPQQRITWMNGVELKEQNVDIDGCDPHDPQQRIKRMN
eukprot:12350043-Karenia_brevis.AAC.1